MNAELLAKMVSDLILDRDEVRLPGLGVFVAELEPATFSDRGYILNPPYRRLRFEQRDSEDDSVIRAYSSGNGISGDQASALLEEYSAGLKEKLLQEGTVELPELGRFRCGREGRILFISDENLDIPFDGIRLEPISLKAHTEVQSLETVPVDVPPVDSFPETDSKESEPAVPEPEIPEAIQKSAITEPVSIPALQGSGGIWWRILLVLLTLAVVALAAFITLAQVAPDFIDSILYTPEELLIINS